MRLVANAKKQYTTRLVYLTIFGYLIIGAIITAAGSAFINEKKIKHGYFPCHTTFE